MKRLPLNLTRAKAFHDGNMTRMWRPMKKQPQTFQGWELRTNAILLHDALFYRFSNAKAALASQETK